jgi:hypothetical protein
MAQVCDPHRSLSAGTDSSGEAMIVRSRAKEFNTLTIWSKRCLLRICTRSESPPSRARRLA